MIVRLFLVAFTLMNSCVAQVATTAGLMAHYTFDGNALDKSGNNNHADFNNAFLTTDRFGNANSAYHFNGRNSYMRIPNKPSLNFDSTITLSVWVKSTGFYYNICHASTILSKGTADYYPGNYALRFDDALYSNGTGCSGDLLVDTLHHNFRGTGTPANSHYPFIVKDKWYHLVYTNNGSTAALYVDCDLKYAVDFKETFVNAEDLFLGKTNDDMFPFWLNGDLDDVRIYNRALLKTEIDTLCALENIPPVPVKKTVPVLENRTNELVKQIIVEHDSIVVNLYDNGDIDGDSVTLIYNDSIITTHQRLSDKAVTFILKVKPGNFKNDLVMYAENLGSIPPNTALMVITDGTKRYEINVSSSKDRNGVVAFKLRE
jgi:hypothetical protein